VDPLLVTCLRGELPLSAEAVRKFGPMHVPIATKGYENLFVALANRKRVDGSTFIIIIIIKERFNVAFSK